MDVGFLFGWAKEQGIKVPQKSDGSANINELFALYNEWKKKGGESKSESVSDSSANDQQNSAEETPEPHNVSALLGEEFKGVKGQDAVNKLLKEKQGHVKGAFHREDIGDIDLIWGDDTCGLQHILKRREEQGINAQEFVKDLAEVVEKGSYRKQNKRGNYELLYNGKMAIVSPELQGNKMTFLVTAFKTTIKK